MRSFLSAALLLAGATPALALRAPPESSVRVQGVALSAEPQTPQSGQTGVAELDLAVSLSLPGSAEEAARALLPLLPQAVGQPGVAFRFDYAQLVPGRPELGVSAMVYAHFIQQADGLDVEGGGLTATMLAGSPQRAFRINGAVYPDARPSPAFSQQGAMNAARALLAPSGLDGDLQYYGPAVAWTGSAWETVQRFVSPQGGLKGFVRPSGAAQFWDDRHYANVTGQAQGRGVFFDPGATPNLDTLPMSDLRVSLSDGNFGFTDETGNFSVPTSAGSVSVTASPTGRWSDVFNCQSISPVTGKCASTAPRLSLSVSATPGAPVSLLFNPTGNVEKDTAQVQGFHHTTKVHNWSRARLGSSGPGMDISIQTFVNMPSICNAFYQGSPPPPNPPEIPSINFFNAGGADTTEGRVECRNTAYDTVVYHEYGHFVDDMFGGIPRARLGSGLSEGWGDTLAAYVSGQSIIGESFFVSRPGLPLDLRNADNTYMYRATAAQCNITGDLCSSNPTWCDICEVHNMGQAWAGFTWDLRKNLIALHGASVGIALAESLVIPTFAANAQDIPSAVLAVLDRDAGVGPRCSAPHLAQINAAAQRHGLSTGCSATGDTTPPTVSITAPSNGATVSGTAVAVAGTASDNVGVVGVQFKLDGNNLGAEDTAAPYGASWNTTLVANGQHVLTAVARDAAGNQATSAPLTVTVNNAAPPSSGSSGPLVLQKVLAYPNPSRGSDRPTLLVDAGGTVDSVDIVFYSLPSGERVDRLSIPSSSVENGRVVYKARWEASGLPSGIYGYAVKVRRGGETARFVGRLALIK